MTTEKRLLSAAAPPVQTADVYQNDETQTIYADGFNRLNVSAAVSKLELYILDLTPPQPEGVIPQAGSTAPVEQRVLTHNVVVPTKALIEFLLLSLRTLKTNQDAMLTAFRAEIQNLETLLNSADVK
jgi:hypothetical protein